MRTLLLAGIVLVNGLFAADVLKAKADTDDANWWPLPQESGGGGDDDNES